MQTITTDAWVLSRSDANRPPKFTRQTFHIAPLAEDEVLTEPLYGSWEGNMTHALKGSPINLFSLRNEANIVLGNSGVVRIIKIGSDVSGLKEGDICLVFCAGQVDNYGYPVTILGYDCPGSMGVLSKQSKFKRRQLIRLPKNQNIPLHSWAAFSLRYISAFANWKVASGAWKLQMGHNYPDACHVVAWGGGVALAELEIAVIQGCNATLITSRQSYKNDIEKRGINVILRTGNEKEILSDIIDITNGAGASVFIDNIGADFRTTVRALARQGVVSTCGWREGMNFPLSRAAECINRHIHVFTHYAHLDEGHEAVQFASKEQWFPRIETPVWKWEDIGSLAAASLEGSINSYFPVFEVSSS